ncbi:SDR family NAD(P)-dependent oxidoreductase [Candidatus Nanohalobium constans]|uniref:UDP-glucose 4-epimerase n=1 Tax=Candidatus Nanohalobium constans TaxID=2565781 RepID=A0A5Q0UH94_9ARCH|nr:SDR family NAD(P)-dependent oxidoreductase [Candidatus Nanohalobium constans]QGA81042.1 UDP-glucose 4-epimerase [Candidatus Nanohalobium constans]
MQMEKALVTGGAGFIGSNIVEKLVEKDVEVTVLDSMYLGTPENLEKIEDKIELIEGSVLDEEKIQEAVNGVDTVFHLAARSSSPMHKEDAAEGARVNIEGFVNVAEAAKEEEVEKVVYASTSSMYGSIEPPHEVDSGEYPMNLYTASKMSRELYAKTYSVQTDVQFTGLRFFSVFGPHEKAKGKYANVVTQFLWKMQDGERPVIWGEGDQERDLIYVEDVAEANIAAAQRIEEADGEVFNVGKGDPQTFNQVVEKLNKVLGTDIEPERIENPRDNYVMQHNADISRTEEVLGWSPEHSFEEGLRKTVEFYKQK